MSNEILNIDPKELVTQANPLDCRYWEIVREEQPKVQEVFPDRAGAVVGADLFNALYHFKPEIRQDPPEPTRAKALGKIMEGSDWMSLHESTMGDELLSAAGSLTLREKLAANTETEDVAEKLDRLQEITQTLQALQEREGDEGEKATEAEVNMQEALQAEAAILGDEVEKALDNKAVVKVIKQAIKDTSGQIKDAVSLAAGWGHEPGTESQILFDPQIAEHLSAGKTKKILDLAGRMRDVVSAERSKRPKAGPQRIEVAMGGDLSKVIPTEIAMLGDPDLEGLFFRKYIEGSLLEYERIEKPRLGKGPFVVCVDESGSMKGAQEEWAKALAFALCTQATREKRQFGAIAFSSSTEQRGVLNPTPIKLLEWIDRFFGGGTNFDKPLEQAIGWIEKGELKDADIVFVTDGECHVSDNTLELVRWTKGLLGGKVIGIQIGTGSLEALKAFCSTTFRLSVEQGTEGLDAVIQELK